MAQGRYSKEVLNGTLGNNGRLARGVKYVAWIEFGDGFVELDGIGSDPTHAGKLARNWLATVTGAMSSSVRRVNLDGFNALLGGFFVRK